MTDEKTTTKKQLRSFGLILAGGFTVIALAPLIRGHNIRTWSLAIAIAFGLLGLIAPQILKPVFRVWMALGEVLAWINTRIILTIVYYALIVPTGVILRLRGKDPMRLKFERDADSYRVVRGKREASHMLRLY
jgi:hypothetical protein